MTPVYACHRTRERTHEVDLRAASSPSQIATAVTPTLRGAESERLLVVAMDDKNHILGLETAYMGTVSAALARVAELFRLPIRLNASCLVIAHNHPSGSLTPSPDDLHLTAEAVGAGRLLDISLLDHLVVADGRSPAGLDHVSFRDRGIETGDVR